VSIDTGATCWLEDYNAGEITYYVNGEISKTLGSVQTATFIIEESGSTYRAWYGANSTLAFESTNIVILINNAMNKVDGDAGAIVIRDGNYSGSGLIQKPVGKSIKLQGEGPRYRPIIYCKGINATEASWGSYTFCIENLILRCNEAVGAMIDCRNVTLSINNAILNGQGLATCGINLEPLTGPSLGSTIDYVDIWNTKDCAAFIGQDWVTVSYLATMYCPYTVTTGSIVMLGGVSPVSGYATSGGLNGINVNMLHLFSSHVNPAYGLFWCARGFIGVLDFEDVTVTTCLLYVGSELDIGRLNLAGVTAPDMLSDWTHSSKVNIGNCGFIAWNDAIDLTNPSVWTSGSHGTQISAFIMIPNNTILTSGNNIFYLYNAWMQEGQDTYSHSQTKVSLTPTSLLPVGIYAYAYDDDTNANHRLAVIIQNNTGGNSTLTIDTYFLLKIC